MFGWGDLFLNSVIRNAMAENEVKLYLKKSEEEYKNFLAQTISTSSPVSFLYARDIIERFMDAGMPSYEPFSMID